MADSTPLVTDAGASAKPQYSVTMVWRTVRGKPVYTIASGWRSVVRGMGLKEGDHIQLEPVSRDPWRLKLAVLSSAANGLPLDRPGVRMRKAEVS